MQESAGSAHAVCEPSRDLSGGSDRAQQTQPSVAALLQGEWVKLG